VYTHTHIHTCTQKSKTQGHRVSRPRGTGSVGDSVGKKGEREGSTGRQDQSLGSFVHHFASEARERRRKGQAVRARRAVFPVLPVLARPACRALRPRLDFLLDLCALLELEGRLDIPAPAHALGCSLCPRLGPALTLATLACSIAARRGLRPSKSSRTVGVCSQPRAAHTHRHHIHTHIRSVGARGTGSVGDSVGEGRYGGGDRPGGTSSCAHSTGTCLSWQCSSSEAMNLCLLTVSVSASPGMHGYTRDPAQSQRPSLHDRLLTLCPAAY
jgi:hypothetical protein